MTAEHNHPPRCCCSTRDVIDGLDGKWHQTGEDDAHPVDQCEAPYCGRICPACPEHGELAPPIECPQCHQPIGRPHTEFCTLAPDRVWPRVQAWTRAETYATGEHNHPDTDNPCPTEWTLKTGEQPPWHRCALPSTHHPATQHRCACGDECQLAIGGIILDELPPGHHLVHSEAFIDQDDPRYTPPEEPK